MTDLISQPLNGYDQAPSYLLNQLYESRRYAAELLTKLDAYRAAVRQTIINNVHNGAIALEAANLALRSLGEQPYVPEIQKPEPEPEPAVESERLMAQL